ncbi:unnamed protein product [Schistosoma margrebowiei]|uniref:Uncharacterized protein n=1 Tax=Schistosoma margrebowiei TaxID=48269 RepID=A0A183MSH7_9TREM|nr:unnamed protein product [Schistosoma margrebowiei]
MILLANPAAWYGMHMHKHIRLPPSTKWLSERFHCQLKSALRAHENGNWPKTLPLVLLGVRTCLKADIQYSAAELVYGTTSRLPGEFFTPRSRPDFGKSDYVHRLPAFMRTLSPVSTRIQHRQVALPRELPTCTRVFTCCKSLQQPYEGSFRVIARHERPSTRVDDSALSDNLRFNARPIKPDGILKSSSDPTLDTPETSFSRPGQQHASSALSTDETTVSRPDQQTTPPLTSDEIAGSRNTNETTISSSGRRPRPSTISVWFRRLQATLTKAGLATHALVNALSRYIGLNVGHTLGLELGRCGRFWSFDSTWFCPTSAVFLVRIPYERNLQILDKNHSGSMPTQATSTAHRPWYRSQKMTFVGNSTMNDRFPVRQFVRSTIALCNTNVHFIATNIKSCNSDSTKSSIHNDNLSLSTILKDSIESYSSSELNETQNSCESTVSNQSGCQNSHVIVPNMAFPNDSHSSDEIPCKSEENMLSEHNYDRKPDEV